jgi:hypothetical protein
LIAAAADRVVYSVQQELVIEGVMHTPIGQPLACMQKYGLDFAEAPPIAATTAAATATAPGTEAPPKTAAATASPPPRGAVASDGPVALRAACLASPVEPVERESSSTAAARAAIARLRASEAQTARGGGAGAAATAEAEDAFCQIELWQRRVALLECGEMAAEYMQTAAAVRRRRRLALVRAMREARDGARGLIRAVRLPLAGTGQADAEPDGQHG